jgi:hypothetical protein
VGQVARRDPPPGGNRNRVAWGSPVARHSQGQRLRPGQAPVWRGRPDAIGRHPGHAQLHGPRAGPGPPGDSRAGRRRLRPGSHPL